MDSANDSDGPAAGAAGLVAETEKPSCHGCRKRKLRCSRELPTCTHCRRLGASCTYDDKKNKPGLKSGAIEGLNRRIEALETALLEKNTLLGKLTDGGALNGIQHPGDNTPGGILSVLSTLCLELCKHNSGLRQTSDRPSGASPESHRSATRPVSATSPTSFTAWQRPQQSSSQDPSLVSHSRKRRRLDSCGNPNIELQLPLEDVEDASLASGLPPPGLLEEVVNVYFDVIQPWIPILHETRFRARMCDPSQLPSLFVVVHAMVVSALRFVHPDLHDLSPEAVEAMAKRSRSIVVLTGMDSLSVENLQALTMIAFTDIGNGDASRAWSLVGSLTRTVEYLQLSVEPGSHDTQPLLKPLVSLPPAQSWVEEEERRRVFWNIFNLDRFCSVATGWNTSLTADDVHRRLPADGGCWYKEEAVTTPYFGIWDRANAKIGHSIAFLPASYSSPDQDSSTETAVPQALSLPESDPATTRTTVTPDMSTVGAFAYCIEATESLSRVTTFFLQQRINFHNRREVSSWLTRFKELDLRLVHWKMFLPRKWKDSNVSRQPSLISMDPNLTLAHATHNTSMILLHQRVAYPPTDWANIVKLPSICSAETCQNAAIETQNITAKYLKYTSERGPVTNQFAFCAFVAARVLLVHWRYYRSELPPALWLLVDGLDEMARRWRGAAGQQAGASLARRRQRCLAETYADHLRDLHQRCVADPSFSVDVLGYSTVISDRSFYDDQPQEPQHEPLQVAQDAGGSKSTMPMLNHSSSAGGYFSGPQQAVSTPAQQMEYGSPTEDELSNISYMLLDQRFLDMDRVISLDNMVFSTGMGSMSHVADDGNIPLAGSDGRETFLIHG